MKSRPPNGSSTKILSNQKEEWALSLKSWEIIDILSSYFIGMLKDTAIKRNQISLGSLFYYLR